MATYIHELKDWPNFVWDGKQLSERLVGVRHRQGLLLGRMSSLGFQLRNEAILENLTEDVLKSSEIEGEILERDQVRSSVARRLGLEIGGLVPSDRNVDGVVEMTLDATQLYAEPLSEGRLYQWHSALFPSGYSGMHKITVGAWRGEAGGPMQVVSGPVGRERVHFEAPEAGRLAHEMSQFGAWFNEPGPSDPVLKSGLAHLWFVTIHPFDDGNGRIARAISDMMLARSEGSPQRFYSMSAQIRVERQGYYNTLEATQRGTMDVTVWLNWFIDCFDRAIGGAEGKLVEVLRKARFWEAHSQANFNDRQRAMINRMLNGFVGNLTTTKWATLTKSSQDTATRDISDLVSRGILVRVGAGRNSHYALA
ncbi:MAG: Fic family protein [Fimbriimonadaceae bacterium]